MLVLVHALPTPLVHGSQKSCRESAGQTSPKSISRFFPPRAILTLHIVCSSLPFSPVVIVDHAHVLKSCFDGFTDYGSHKHTTNTSLEDQSARATTISNVYGHSSLLVPPRSHHISPIDQVAGLKGLTPASRLLKPSIQRCQSLPGGHQSSALGRVCKKTQNHHRLSSQPFSCYRHFLQAYTPPCHRP